MSKAATKSAAVTAPRRDDVVTAEVLAQYEAGATTPDEAIRGLTVKDLLASPPPGSRGTWTIQHIIMHLMDSDLIASDRMKRIVAEDNPQLIGYDENRFAERLAYEKLDAAAACEIFRLNRMLTAALLRSLPPAAFERTGEHNERGTITLASLVHSYIRHLDHHMDFLREKRRLLGR
jgi:hypothetical protein